MDPVSDSVAVVDKVANKLSERLADGDSDRD